MSPLSLSPRISVSGVVPQVAGRPRPGARGLGPWDAGHSGQAPGVTGHCRDTRRRLSPVVRRQQTGQHRRQCSDQWWGDPPGQHDAVFSEKTLTLVFSVKCSLRHWVNTLKQVTRVFLLWWCTSDCALWMPPDMTIASMFCLGHGRKRTQLPLSDSILLDQRDEKPKASGEFSSNCRKKIEFRRFLMDSKLGYNKTF